MGDLLKVKGRKVNKVLRVGHYIIKCLKISELGTQWGRLSS